MKCCTDSYTSTKIVLYIIPPLKLWHSEESLFLQIEQITFLITILYHGTKNLGEVIDPLQQIL